MAVAQPLRPYGEGVAPSITPTTPPIPMRVQLSPRQPLLYAALSFAAGILLGTHVWRPPLW
jgi:hypothetical protein